MQLNPNGAAEFKKKIENEIIPVLRKQKGFRDEITRLYPNGKEVHAFSLWETAEDAEAYSRGAYPALAKSMAPLVEGVLSRSDVRSPQFDYSQNRELRFCLKRASARSERRGRPIFPKFVAKKEKECICCFGFLLGSSLAG